LTYCGELDIITATQNNNPGIVALRRKRKMFIRLCVAALIVVLATPTARAVYQDGIDVSNHQGTINWTSVKNAGIKFVFAKATEDVGFTDAYLAANMSGAKANGILIGPYHYARPDLGKTDPNDAANEANYFVNAIKPYYQGTNQCLRPVLDLETLSNTRDEKTFLSNWVNSFATTMHNALGFYPLIYTNTNYATNYLNSTVSQYDLWLANWTYDKNSPPSSSADGVFNGWKFWQYADNGMVSGISGVVDLDVFNGALSDLNQYLAAIPEPNSILLLMIGFICATARRGKRAAVTTRRNKPKP
jgi:GH25 family lysozyme M1 (1,4-beta-N-acetylmuramidase)